MIGEGVMWRFHTIPLERLTMRAPECWPCRRKPRGSRTASLCCMRSNTGGRAAKDAPAWRRRDRVAARSARRRDRSQFCRTPRQAHRRDFGWLPVGPVCRSGLPTAQRPALPAPIIQSRTRGGPLSRDACDFRFKPVGVFVQPLQDRRQRRGLAARNFRLADRKGRLDFRNRWVHQVFHGTNIGDVGQNVEESGTRSSDRRKPLIPARKPRFRTAACRNSRG